MRLFRRRFKDPAGAWQTSKKWSVRISVRGRIQEVSLGLSDRHAAELEARRLFSDAQVDETGNGDPFRKHRARSLSSHVDDFETTLKGRGVVQKYFDDRVGCVRAFVEATGAKCLADLDLSRASAWLTTLKAPKVVDDATQETVTLSARTVNRHYQALRQFGFWLVRCRRIAFDPFAGLVPLNEAADRRHVRRALTPHEVAKLIAAVCRRLFKTAEKERTRSGVTERERARLVVLGEARALAYSIAVGAGLRRGEVRRLRWCDVDFPRACIIVPAASAKARCEQTVEVHANLFAVLHVARPKDVVPTATVIPGAQFPTIRTFWADLARARIPRQDKEERVVDFHALRTTFISLLASSGAHPRVAQALARHASIETTMGTYTDLRLLDLRGTVEKLPLPSLTPRTKAGTAARPLSLPLSLSGATSLQLVAPQAQDPREVEDAPDCQASRKDAQGTAKRMERVMGLEPTTFSLGS